MTSEELLQETHDTVIELKTVLLGANNDKGLIGKVETVCTSLEILNEKHNKLSNKFWVLVGVLAGGGVLGTGIYELFKVL